MSEATSNARVTGHRENAAFQFMQSPKGAAVTCKAMVRWLGKEVILLQPVSNDFALTTEAIEKSS